MQRIIRVIFIVDNLNAGGAERVIRTLADKFNKNIFEVTLLLFNYNDNNQRKYTLPSNINIVILNRNKKFALFALTKTIRKISPDIVFSTLAPVNIICILAKLLIRDNTIKFIIRETTIKSISIENTKKRKIEKLIYKYLIRSFYNYADSIIALSEGAKRDLVENFGVIESKVKVIYNPLDIEEITEKSLENVQGLNPESIKIVCVGSLLKSKGHIFLIQAIEILIKEYQYPIEAYFIGNGKMKDVLYNEVSKRNLISNIHFLGFRTNPYKYVRNSDIFVLPSLWEGFGNVIIEAMACNTPVISTSCESGPKEIITNTVNGLLVEPHNIEALVNAIKSIIENEELRYRIVMNGAKRAQDFNVKIIVKEYENHVISLLK